jgi:hypothetical protein
MKRIINFSKNWAYRLLIILKVQKFTKTERILKLNQENFKKPIVFVLNRETERRPGELKL